MTDYRPGNPNCDNAAVMAGYTRHVIIVTGGGMVDVLSDYFEAEPADLSALGGRMGYIVEPQDSGPLAEYLHAHSCAWVVK